MFIDALGYSFLADSLLCSGAGLTKLCLESIQFDVDIGLVRTRGHVQETRGTDTRVAGGRDVPRPGPAQRHQRPRGGGAGAGPLRAGEQLRAVPAAAAAVPLPGAVPARPVPGLPRPQRHHRPPPPAEPRPAADQPPVPGLATPHRQGSDATIFSVDSNFILQCVLDILSTGGLCHLTKFVVSAPISVDHRTVPLSQVTSHVAVL